MNHGYAILENHSDGSWTLVDMSHFRRLKEWKSDEFPYTCDFEIDHEYIRKTCKQFGDYHYSVTANDFNKDLEPADIVVYQESPNAFEKNVTSWDCYSRLHN